MVQSCMEAVLQAVELSPYDAEAAELVLALPSGSLRAETRGYAGTRERLQIGATYAVELELHPWPDERGLVRSIQPSKPALLQARDSAYRASGVTIGQTQTGLTLLDVGLSEPLACDIAIGRERSEWLNFEGVLHARLSGITHPNTVPLPAVPRNVRRAMLSYFAEYITATSGADERWITEASGIDYSYVGEHVHTSAAHSILLRAGINVAEPVDYMELVRQGSSTFSFLPSRNGEWCIRVTELVPAVHLSNSGTFRWRPHDGAAHVPGPPGDLARDIAHELVAGGFSILGPGCLSTTVSGLKVYFFGPAQELTIEQLLFYWQD